MRVVSIVQDLFFSVINDRQPLSGLQPKILALVDRLLRSSPNANEENAALPWWSLVTPLLSTLVKLLYVVSLTHSRELRLQGVLTHEAIAQELLGAQQHLGRGSLQLPQRTSTVYAPTRVYSTRSSRFSCSSVLACKRT